jgi:hypothetical protein
LRLAPFIVVLVPVLVIACEDDEVRDCTDQGGLCSIGGVTGAPVYVACDGPELDTNQCRQSGRVTGSCCRPKKCAEGRGICMSPCASGRRIFPSDSDCSFGGAVTDCCEP